MSVFISYSHKDAAFVDHLAIKLAEKNVKVWKDQWKTLVGDSFVKKIREGIEGASHFCVVLSTNSLASKWVKEEIRAALVEESKREDIVILPILLDDSELPEGLSDRLYADFRSDFDAGFRQVLAAVGTRYNIEDSGRIQGASTYYFDYGIERGSTDGRFFMQLDIVSFDLEEEFSILSQFIFRGHEEISAASLELAKDQSLEDFVLWTCAEEFEACPARVTLRPGQTVRARFHLQDAEGASWIDVEARIKRLGGGPRETALFNVGALFKQVCAVRGRDAGGAQAKRTAGHR